MSQIKIAVVVGSLRKDSFNKNLAAALAKMAPADVMFENIRLDDLPHYNQDDDGAPTAEVTRLRNQIRSMRKALTAKEFSGLQAVFSTTVSVIDKAAQKGYIKRGTAARYKSRIHKKVKTALGQLQTA